MRKPILTLVITLLAGGVGATTWVDVTVQCPVCGTENEFHAIGSYGSYIYDWPEKYQFVFWPTTDGKAMRSCRQCRYTAWLWDFESLPPERVADVKAALQEQGLAELEGGYQNVAMTERMAIARSVYEVLDRDAGFWCEFERILGYHAEEEGKEELARQARRRALELVQELLVDPEQAAMEKQLRIIEAAMMFHLGDVEGARSRLERATGLTYANPELSESERDDADLYQSKLIFDYLNKLDGGDEDSHHQGHGHRENASEDHPEEEPEHHQHHP